MMGKSPPLLLSSGGFCFSGGSLKTEWDTKHMDMINELDRRVKSGVRNIKISPLFEKGKLYNLKTELEDNNGNLRPEWNHCWLTWQSLWFDENSERRWSNEAYNFKTIKEAEEAKKYLEEKVVE
jgi:hypothetical protein